MQSTTQNKSTGPLPKLLGIVFVIFMGILIGSYFVARDANPVILDEHGNIRH